MSVEVTDFDAEVLEASRQAPVLVDFWAPWCGPCRFLGPVLERLADEETNGRWQLAKVNTDEHPEVSMRYGIRGIPAVKMFVNGVVVDEFTGALPEQAVRQWLDKALPSEAKKRLDAADSALVAGDTAGAETLLRAVLADEPENAKAGLLLAKLVLFDDPEQAESLAVHAPFAGPAFLQLEESIGTIVRLLRMKGDASVLDDAPEKERYLEGVEALSRQDFEAALDAFLEVIRSNRYYDDDGSRKACVAIFSILGEQHPVTKTRRRAFDMALY